MTRTLTGVRTAAAVGAAKLAATFSRRLGFGGGTALPGLMAEAVAPGLASRLVRELGHGCLLVTGTNGKTTTARLVRNVARAAGFWPVHNGAGSNMMRGITAALSQAADAQGRIPQGERRLGVFEVDEATVPEAADALAPRVIAFTNLFRDQLDRYGEVDSVAALWREALAGLPSGVTVVLNADDPGVAGLADACRGPIVFYGVADAACAVGGLEHAADARWCPACGHEYAYSAVFYGHVGHWACAACDRARPAAQVEAVRVEQAAAGLGVTVTTPVGRLELSLPLIGVYNVYNALAAAATAVALGVEAAATHEGVASFTAAFGRQERFEVRGRDVQTILAKNPAGLNQVLRALVADGGRLKPSATSDSAPKNLLFFLNDDIADGRDVSWIWDVDFEMLALLPKGLLLASGRRAADMALRLKYAGLDPDPVLESNVERALARALSLTPAGGTLYVVPTYTAMLQVRRVLARWGHRPQFWEET